jgi:flagellar motor switch protein FliG
VGSTPKFAKTVSSKYSEFGGKRVQADLQNNHGRFISHNYAQDISNAVG